MAQISFALVAKCTSASVARHVLQPKCCSVDLYPRPVFGGVTKFITVAADERALIVHELVVFVDEEPYQITWIAPPHLGQL